MRPLLSALAALALLRAAGANGSASLRKPTWIVGEPIETTADPSIPSRGDSARSTGCDIHVAILGRLDVIEETVEKTVEHLEAEVKGLLSQLEGLAWNLPPGPFSPTPDLLGDDH